MLLGSSGVGLSVAHARHLGVVEVSVVVIPLLGVILDVKTSLTDSSWRTCLVKVLFIVVHYLISKIFLKL